PRPVPDAPLLDLDALTAPVPGPDPAGRPLPKDVRDRLVAARPGPDEEDAAPAAWGAVVLLAAGVLTDTSKHLLVAARLTEALTHNNASAGLRDGLQLLARLCDEAWGRLYPELGENNDAGVRLGPINWLNDRQRGAKLPYAICRSPLVQLPG